MNNHATQAYGMTGGLALRGRTLEGRAFSRAAQLLNDARETPDDRVLAIKALRFNHQLWTILQGSLLEDASVSGSTMDASLHDNLLSLSLFIDRRTAEALTNADPALLDALISINRDIAQGQLASE